MMPVEHGSRLTALLSRERLVEIADSYTLIPRDRQRSSPTIYVSFCDSNLSAAELLLM